MRKNPPISRAPAVSASAVTIVALALLAAFFISSTERAQAQSIMAPVPSCVSLDQNLRRGMSSRIYGQYVSSLQQFLASRGHLASAYAGTGYFGPLTYAAVVRFQAAEGLPQTGFVGPLTRARIHALWCGGVPGPVTLYSISPSRAKIGDSVTVSGIGFTDANRILIDGMVAMRNVPASRLSSGHQVITFTLPEYLSPNCPDGAPCLLYVRQLEPGTYPLTVVNSKGTSNTILITVVEKSVSGKLSINGIDAPNSLPIGVSGTWTLHVTAPSDTSRLRYSVTWGDEASYVSALGFRAPDSFPQSNTATFSHTYSHTGTYTPTFTVSDDNGNSVTASASVTITPLY